MSDGVEQTIAMHLKNSHKSVLSTLTLQVGEGSRWVGEAKITNINALMRKWINVVVIMKLLIIRSHLQQWATYQNKNKSSD